jgi:hypothetical protein
VVLSLTFTFQLTNLGKRVFNSPTLREDLKVSCERSKTKPMLMLRAVATRWNTMVELIGRALKLREALNLLVNLEQHNKGSRGVRLNRFKLSKQEWDLLVQLHPLLEVFSHFLLSHSFLQRARFFLRRQKRFPRAILLFSMKSSQLSISLPAPLMTLWTIR